MGTAVLVSAIISAAVAYGVAVMTVNRDRERSAKRAALDIITRELQPSWATVRATARQTVTNTDYWSAVVNPQKTEDFERRGIVVTFLNHHEMIAIAIKQQAVDESLFKDWAHATYVHSWDISKGFIGHWKDTTKHNMGLSNFKELAEKWRESLPQPIHEMKLHVGAPESNQQVEQA